MAERAERPDGSTQGFKVIGAVLAVLVAAVVVGALISGLFVDRPFPFSSEPRPVEEPERPPVLGGELMPEPEGAPGQPRPEPPPRRR